jgi:hypothetical protein
MVAHAGDLKAKVKAMIAISDFGLNAEHFAKNPHLACVNAFQKQSGRQAGVHANERFAILRQQRIVTRPTMRV